MYTGTIIFCVSPDLHSRSVSFKVIFFYPGLHSMVSMGKGNFCYCNQVKGMFIFSSLVYHSPVFLKVRQLSVCA